MIRSRCFAAIVFLVLGALFGLVVQPYVSASDRQRPAPAPALAAPDATPDTESERWKPIGRDVALWMSEGRNGFGRATLYVHGDDGWRPVVLDGALDLLPQLLPAETR
jgi:hypothetical protein